MLDENLCAVPLVTHDDECFWAILDSPDGVELVQDALCGRSLLGTSLNEHLIF